ncbi:MAG: DUF429 domain-containing protein [Tepidisphaeraceae bacterium]
MMRFRQVIGVDFSGARLAGDYIWVARTTVGRDRLKLVALDRLSDLCGSSERVPALRRLVELIRESTDSLWGIDFPFALPIEIMPPNARWPEQLAIVVGYSGGAPEFGRWCLDRAKKLNGPLHIRRSTDRDVATPFDCYHYRIIYQTFHGMRDVLTPLARDSTRIAPFDYPRMSEAGRVVVEACPGSTLKRMRLPHQNYKQPAGGPLIAKRRATRHKIVAGLKAHIDIPQESVRAIMRNPGGDALDAVIAALGVHRGWTHADHDAIAAHPRYPLEGYIYA